MTENKPNDLVDRLRRASVNILEYVGEKYRAESELYREAADRITELENRYNILSLSSRRAMHFKDIEPIAEHFSMTSYHVSQCIRGALNHWNPKSWKGCVRDKDGKIMTPKQVKAKFEKLLAEGKEFIVFGDCDNFDFKRGCLGHEEAEEWAKAEQAGEDI